MTASGGCAPRVLIELLVVSAIIPASGLLSRRSEGSGMTVNKTT